MTERVLVVFPHPDDEAFAVSGTLAKLIAEGAHVTYACLTLGEMGRNLGVPVIANRVTLPQIRKKELIASCQAIGIHDLRCLGYLDKTIEFEPHQKIDHDIKAIMDEVKPTLVITFLPGFSVHPDHNATGEAVIRVLSNASPQDRPTVWCVAFAHNTYEVMGEPDIAVDISKYLTYKRNALSAHATQVQVDKMFGDWNKDYDAIVKRFGTEHFWSYRFQ